MINASRFSVLFRSPFVAYALDSLFWSALVSPRMLRIKISVDVVA